MTTTSAPARTNVFAIIGFICAFLIPVVGIVFGALALRQISDTREAGRGLARWAIGLGLIGTIAQVTFFAVWLSLVLSAINGGLVAP